MGEHKTDYASSGNHYLDDVAYWAHTNDLRPCTAAGADGTIAVLNVTGHCLQGLQNISVYTFFAFGSIEGREILMHTAKLGGFEDSNNNNLPDLVTEWDKVVNATGAPGTDGIPDNFFESANADDLQDRLMATITAILRKSSSGTAISVLATSASGEGSVYQAYFYTSTVGQGGANVRWTGYTQGLFIDHLGNFREDTDQDGKLIYQNDYIIKTRYDNNQASLTYGQVLVDKYGDANGDGAADDINGDGVPDPAISGLGLKDILPFWEGGKQLANLASSSRNLLTWVDTDNDGLVDAGEEMQFSTANSTTLSPYLRAGAAPYTADNIINFVRGDEIAGLRTRMVEVPIGSGTYKVWKLGDPIHSTPTIVAAPRTNYDLIYGDSSYTAFFTKWKDRREVIYVGANDGMLHAFNGGFYHKSDDVTTAGVVHPLSTPAAVAVVDESRLQPRLLCGSQTDSGGCEDLHARRGPSKRLGHDSDRGIPHGRELWKLCVRHRRPSDDGQYQRDAPYFLQCLLCARYHQSGCQSQTSLELQRCRVGAYDSLSDGDPCEPNGGFEDRQHQCEVDGPVRLRAQWLCGRLVCGFSANSQALCGGLEGWARCRKFAGDHDAGRVDQVVSQ
jgi:hypothetical protein